IEYHAFPVVRVGSPDAPHRPRRRPVVSFRMTPRGVVHMYTRTRLSAASILLACAGTAYSQPVVDGTRDASYGPPLWVPNLPTHSGDNAATGGPCTPVGGGITIAINTSNTAGVTGGSTTGADTVATGMEIRIPLTTLGINPLDPATIKIAGFIN